MNFEKYIRQSHSGIFIVTLLFCIFPAILTYLIIFKTGSVTNMLSTVILTVFLWLIPLFSFQIFLIPYFTYKRKMKWLAESGLLKIAEEDFSRAESFFVDSIRVGERFVYRAGGEEIILIGSFSKMRMNKTVYTGDRSGEEWSYILVEDRRNIEIFHTEESVEYYRNEWERLAKKLSDLNPDLIVDRNIETRFVHITHFE